VNSTQATARRAGALYFLFMIVAIVGEFRAGWRTLLRRGKLDRPIGFT